MHGTNTTLLSLFVTRYWNWLSLPLAMFCKLLYLSPNIDKQTKLFTHHYCYKCNIKKRTVCIALVFTHMWFRSYLQCGQIPLNSQKRKRNPSRASSYKYTIAHVRDIACFSSNARRRIDDARQHLKCTNDVRVAHTTVYVVIKKLHFAVKPVLKKWLPRTVSQHLKGEPETNRGKVKAIMSQTEIRLVRSLCRRRSRMNRLVSFLHLSRMNCRVRFSNRTPVVTQLSRALMICPKHFKWQTSAVPK